MTSKATLVTLRARECVFAYPVLGDICGGHRKHRTFPRTWSKQMSKIAIAFVALALGGGSTAMAKSYRAPNADGYGMQRQAGSPTNAGVNAYGRAISPDGTLRDSRDVTNDPDVRIRARMRRDPNPAAY
jgi:hypothetical protein